MPQNAAGLTPKPPGSTSGLPASKQSPSRRLFIAQAAEEFRAWNLPRAERLEVRGELLDIHPGRPSAAEMIREMQQTKLRAVVHMVKHAFTGENPAGIDPV